MDAAESRFVETRVALIESLAVRGGAECRAAIAEKVFGAGEDSERIGQGVALESKDRGSSEVAYDGGIFGIAFVGPAPTRVLRNCHAGRERPIDTGGASFLRGDLHDPFHQRGVARAAEPNVVREDHSTQY